jgi:xanthine permease XanP
VAYRRVYPAFQPVFSSGLTLATVAVILLNLIFRVGIRKRAELTLSPGEKASEVIFDFMENQGAPGARGGR